MSAFVDDFRPGTMVRVIYSTLIGLSLLLVTRPGAAAVIHLNPGSSFENAVEALSPGDTLIVHAGTYAESGRVAVTVRGTQSQPVVIEAATGEARPLITRSGGAVENTIDIAGATWLTIRGLEITGSTGDGVNMSGSPSYITLEDLEIHDILVGINFRSSMHHITARRNHIYDTADTGEGMYVGCHDGSCAVSDSLIEGNWIHDTASSDQGDGIEIKKGSHSNVIRDNVIHDTNYPCIILYGTQGNPPNIVERNVMWNCPDAGIQVAADAVIRNNIIIPVSGGGLSSQSNNGVSPGNLTIVNNTFIGGSPCLRMNGWSGRPNMTFANNAVYCPTAEFVIGALTGVTLSGNVVDEVPPNFSGSSYTPGRSMAQDFVNAAARNVYPTATAPLLGAANAANQPADDFNGTARGSTADAGAYVRTTAGNPGWTVGPGFKGSVTAPSAPSVSLTATPASVAWQGSATLNWSTSGAQSCTASGAWSGSRNVSGSLSTGALTANATYTLVCANSTGQTGSATATVQVAAQPPSPPAAPTLSFSATSTTVTSGASTTLSWTTTGATSCQASGGWTGTKPTAGNSSTGTLSSTTTFTQTCTGTGGNVARSVTVTALPAAPAPGGDSGGDPSADAASGGSGSMDLWFGLLPLLAAWRRRRRMYLQRAPLALAAVVLAGCGGGSNSGPSAVALNFIANPVTIGTGTAATLSWTADNATACTASGGWSGPKGTADSQSTGNLSATTTYTLSCTGDGDGATQSVTVTVTSTPPAPTVTLTASPATISSGASSTLTWSSSNATSCTASSGWSGPKATSGSQSTGALTVTTTYTLSCTGTGGTANTSRTVTVASTPPAPTVTLTASPATISSGASSTLTWSSSNATSCTASSGWSGPKATSGSQSTGALTVTTTYTLSCTGTGGTANTSRTVTVASTPPAPTVTLTASPATISSGASSTLTWSSSNATSCTASSGWSGPKATSGSQSTGALTVTTTYNLSCTGTGGTANASRTVIVTSSSSIYPLHTEAGKRYLLDAQNTPFFMNGDTAWSLIVQLNATETEQYLEDRRQRGVNTVLVELIEHEFADDAPRNRAGQAPFLTPGDYATPNDAYFNYALSVIDRAAAKGMLVLLTPSYMGYPGATPVEGWYEEMTANGTTKLRNYGRYIGQRFAGRDNILWVHGGDRDPPASPGLQLANAIVAGIQESDPTGRWLHTWHAERGTSAGDSVAGGEPWLSVNNIYTSSSDVVDEAFAEYASSNLPVFLSEARYEDNGGDGLFIRQQAYQALLSGATAGHLMGNDPMWYFGNNWQSVLDSEGARSLPFIKSLFTTRQWWLLGPDTGGNFLTGGISSGANRAVASLASDDSLGLVYTPAVRTLTVNLAELNGPRVNARWFDPASGGYTTIAGSPFIATGSQAFAPAGTNSQGAPDWVLVLESVP